MGGKSSKTTSGPSKFAKPYISAAANTVQDAYQGNQANINNLTGILQDNLPGVVSSTLNNPTLAAANSYDQDVLSGKYLGAGNPYLNAQIAATNGDVTNGVNAGIGTRGLTGGSAQAQLLARELAKNETNLRYTDYTNERANMGAAATNAGALSSANGSNLAALLAYIQETGALPQSGAQSYASSIGSLLGNSTTSTQSQSTGLALMNFLGQAAGNAAAAFGGGGG